MLKYAFSLILVLSFGCSSLTYYVEKGNSKQKTFNAGLDETWDTALLLIRENGQKIETVDKKNFIIEVTDGKNFLTSNKMKVKLTFVPLKGNATKVLNEVFVVAGTNGFHNSEPFDEFLEDMQDTLHYNKVNRKGENLFQE